MPPPRRGAAGAPSGPAVGPEGGAGAAPGAGIEPWQNWFGSPGPPDATQALSLPRAGPGWPALRLRRLRLENIKGFSELRLDFAARQGAARRCAVIVGDNSIGKTTILQCIALGILGPKLASQVAGLRVPDLLRNGTQQGTIELELELAVDPDATRGERGVLTVGLGLAEGQKESVALPDDQLAFGKRNAAAHVDALRGRTDFQWGFCCGYGAFRGLRERPEPSGANPTHWVEIDRVLSLFQPQSTLLEPATLEALLQADVSSLSSQRKTIPLGVRDELLREVFPRVIPGLMVQEQDGRPRLGEADNAGVPLSGLSDGCNSMAGLLGHLARHALELNGWFQQPESWDATQPLTTPRQVGGIVLIDEVDLHLHPSWQRRALSQLLEAYPRLQLIVSTHSPLVLGVWLAAPGEEWTKWWRRLEEAADDADALLDLMDMAWRDWWEELKAEEPLLLHPYIDDPQEHFAAKKNGVLLGLTECGRKTIAVCDLNRQCLCDQREAAAEKTLGRRDRYLDRLRLDGRATLEVFTEAEAFSTYCNSRLRKELRAYLKGLETGQIPDWESIDAN